MRVKGDTKERIDLKYTDWSAFTCSFRHVLTHTQWQYIQGRGLSVYTFPIVVVCTGIDPNCGFH